MTFPLPLTELNVGIMVALDLIQGVGYVPPGYQLLMGADGALLKGADGAYLYGRAA